mgnify:CR=1 FL=1
MSKNISHGRAFAKSSAILHIVNIVKQIEAQRETLFCDVVFTPNLELKIGIDFLIDFKHFLFRFGHLAFDPN